MEKAVNIKVMMVECLIRSERTDPGCTEFTVTLEPGEEHRTSIHLHTIITAQESSI